MISKEEYKRLVQSEIEHLDLQTQITILEQLDKRLQTHESNSARIEQLGSPLQFIERAVKFESQTENTVKDTQDDADKSEMKSSSNSFLLVLSLFVSIPLYLVLITVTLTLWGSSLALTISGIWLLLFNHLPFNLVLWIQDKTTNSLLGIAFILVGIGFSMLAQRGFSGMYHGLKWLRRFLIKGTRL